METDWPSEWLRAALRLAVLALVDRTERAYGYRIAALLAKGGLGEIQGGTLYPLLRRLEQDDLVRSWWEEGISGPGRKHYRITTAGSAELERGRRLWSEFSVTVRKILNDGMES